MRLTSEEARRRLVAQDHGVLATLHPERGVDAVPVVFAVGDDGFVGVPVDRVKPKASARLRREDNLAADPRATLLVDQWDAQDWSRLWWVRAQLLWQQSPSPEREQALTSFLRQRYPQYREASFARVLVLRIVSVTGWSGAR